MEQGNITNAQIKASSVYGQHFAQYGRLNWKGTTKGWCAAVSDTKQYLQVRDKQHCFQVPKMIYLNV